MKSGPRFANCVLVGWAAGTCGEEFSLLSTNDPSIAEVWCLIDDCMSWNQYATRNQSCGLHYARKIEL